MRRDSPLAQRTGICPEDLYDNPLILNRNTRDGDFLTTWLGKSISELNITATYNLLFNASLMVEEGLGYAFALDKIINTTGKENLCFVPCDRALNARMNLIWKKYQILPKAAKKFLEEFQELLENFL